MMEAEIGFFGGIAFAGIVYFVYVKIKAPKAGSSGAGRGKTNNTHRN